MATDPRAPTTLIQERSRAATGRFSGKTAVITGASDRGIGGAIAERLAREGASVSVLSLHRPLRLCERLEENGTGVLWTHCDVRCQEEVDHGIEASLREFGKIDCLVNNSGVEIASSLIDMTDDQWQQLIDVNLSGVMRVTRAVLPHMERDGGGVIVNIASVSGMAGTPGLSAYSATKAGVIGLTRSLALELAPKNVRVVAVAPAVVKTPMASQYAAKMTSEIWEQLQACHPLGIGAPADVAAAVAFLASDEARWITGVVLPMGWLPSFPLPFDALNDLD